MPDQEQPVGTSLAHLAEPTLVWRSNHRPAVALDCEYLWARGWLPARAGTRRSGAVPRPRVHSDLVRAGPAAIAPRELALPPAAPAADHTADRFGGCSDRVR